MQIQKKDLLGNERIISNQSAKIERILSLAIFIWLVVSVLIPRILISDVNVGLDDFEALALFPMFIALLFSQTYIASSSRLFLVGLWIFIIISGIASGIIGSGVFLSHIVFPTEMWQYVKRMIFFFIPAYFAYKGLINGTTASKVILIVCLLASAIGILQLLHGPVGLFLAGLYSPTAAQYAGLVNRNIFDARVYGFTGMPDSWGGFSMLVAVYAMSILNNRVSYFQLNKKTWKLVAFVVLLGGVINVFISGSRVALAALICSLMSTMVIRARLNLKISKTIAKRMLLLFILLAVVSLILWSRIEILIYRFEILPEQLNVKNGRLSQIKLALTVLGPWWTYVIGVGNAVQRTVMTYGTEVEPIYLFVNYGVVGVIARYAILGYLLWLFMRSRRLESQPTRVYADVTASAIVGYLVLSLGYFFFQEIYAGLLPWIIFGLFMGYFHKNAHGTRLTNSPLTV